MEQRLSAPEGDATPGCAEINVIQFDLLQQSLWRTRGPDLEGTQIPVDAVSAVEPAATQRHQRPYPRSVRLNTQPGYPGYPYSIIFMYVHVSYSC